MLQAMDGEEVSVQRLQSKRRVQLKLGHPWFMHVTSQAARQQLWKRGGGHHRYSAEGVLLWFWTCFHTAGRQQE